MTLPTSRTPLCRPWWREPMLWLVLGGPALVVVASLVTAVIAWRGADPVVTDPPVAVGVERSLEPALKARNHAASPR